MRSPSGFSPMKGSYASKTDINKFASPFLMFSSVQSQNNVTNFQHSLLDIRKDARNHANELKQASNLKSWDNQKWQTSTTESFFNRNSPRSTKNQSSFLQKPKTQTYKSQLDDIISKRPQTPKDKIARQQTFIDKMFKHSGSPVAHRKMNSTHIQGHFEPTITKGIITQDRQLNDSFEKINRYKSYDADLDVKLKIQRDSLEKRLGKEKSWSKFFNTSRATSPAKQHTQIHKPVFQSIRSENQDKVPLSEVVRLTNKLGEITLSDANKLSPGYISELYNLQDTVTRIIKSTQQHSWRK